MELADFFSDRSHMAIVGNAHSGSLSAKSLLSPDVVYGIGLGPYSYQSKEFVQYAIDILLLEYD